MKMRRSPILVLAALLGLSATAELEREPTPTPSPVCRANVREGPGAVEFIEARFHDYQAGLSPREIREVAETIVRESQPRDLPWELVLAVIHTESGFHNFAVSKVGALGLMQIMPATGAQLARELRIDWQGPRTLFDPVPNVRMGTRYLAQLRGRYGDWDRALAAYNWGPERIDGRIQRGRALPVRYAQTVLARLQSPLTP